MKKEYLRTEDVEAVIKKFIEDEEKKWEKLCDRLEIVEEGGTDKNGLTASQLDKRMKYSEIREVAYRKVLTGIINLAYGDEKAG